jgi:integrase
LVRIYTGRDETGKKQYDNKTLHCTKKEAQAWLSAKLTERDQGTYTSPKSVLVGVLLDDLLADYQINGKDYEWAERVVRVHLRPFFGNMKVSSVGTDAIRRYIAMRQQPATRVYEHGPAREYGPASNATINRGLALLQRAFNLAKKATPPKIRVVPYFPILAENNVRKGFFEDQAFVAVRRALPEEIRPILTFAYFTGTRKSEILGLRWSQVDLAERLVRLEVGETKNDEGRTIPLVAELFEVLAIEKQRRDEYWPESPWVFSRAGARILNFRKAWANAVKAAGLDGAAKLFHDLRRTGVRNLVRAGVPEKVAMAISGHKTRSVFDRYNVTSTADLKDAARKLGEYIAEKRTETERHTIDPQTPPAVN